MSPDTLKSIRKSQKWNSIAKRIVDDSTTLSELQQEYREFGVKTDSILDAAHHSYMELKLFKQAKYLLRLIAKADPNKTIAEYTAKEPVSSIYVGHISAILNLITPASRG